MITFNNYNGIAKVNMITGEITVNHALYLSLPEIVRKFILLHEKAHFLLKTDNEFLCDLFAFKHLVFTEKQSLKKLIKALDILPFSTLEHYQRKLQLINHAYYFDNIKKNQKDMNKNFNYTTGSGGVDYMGLLTQGLDLYSKYNQAGNQAGTQTATVTQPANVTITPNIQLGQAHKEPQNSTISYNVSGGTNTTAPAEKKDNTFLYIGLGVGVLAIIAVAIFLIKKKGV